MDFEFEIEFETIKLIKGGDLCSGKRGGLYFSRERKESRVEGEE